MATKLVCPTESEWEVLESFFRRCGGGAVVLSPKAQRQLHDRVIHSPVSIELAGYDFGGEPDIMLDVVHDLADGHYALNALRQSLARGGE